MKLIPARQTTRMKQFYYKPAFPPKPALPSAMAWEYFLNKLQADFGNRAEDQLDIAISWGRHAELFAYDDDTGELYLE